MKTIVAIGGIDENSTLEGIEKELIRLTKKKNPKMLFLPTAGGDDTRNYKLVKNIFENSYNCHVDVLFLVNEEPSQEKIKHKVYSSDIIYVGGGSVARLMSYFNKFNMKKIFQEASERGIIIAGMSAGAICWGRDYLDIYSSNNHTVIECINLLDLIFCPHYNKNSFQNYVREFDNRIKEYEIVGIALDNNCAIEFVGNKYRVITTKDNANAYKLYIRNSELTREVINKESQYRDIKELY